MNDKRDGMETAPDSVKRIIADLETVDKKLARASGEDSASAEIAEARALLRTAIDALARSVPADTGAAKQRVKIKAESEVTASDAVPSAPAEGGKSAAKPAGRATRAQAGARNGQQPAAVEKPSGGSLIARLGAATVEPSPASSEKVEPAAATAQVAKPVPSTSSANDTAERLAQLEAEIADLTEAVTTSPSRGEPREPEDAVKPVEATRPTESRTAPPAKLDEADSGNEDDDDAEITILGSDGVPAEPSTSSARRSPRIFREEHPAFDDEAEVEIRGQGSAPADGRGVERLGSVRVSTRTSVSPGKGGAFGKWRLFRNS